MQYGESFYVRKPVSEQELCFSPIYGLILFKEHTCGDALQ